MGEFFPSTFSQTMNDQRSRASVNYTWRDEYNNTLNRPSLEAGLAMRDEPNVIS